MTELTATAPEAAKAPDAAKVLTLTRRFDAPREAVFRAWSEASRLAEWFGPESVTPRKVEIDLRPGGAYSLEMHGGEGKVHALSGVYREISPPERLVFTWVWGSGDLAGLESLVTVELAEAGGGTELTLTHENLPSDTAREHHGQGWTSTMESLAKYLKT